MPVTERLEDPGQFTIALDAATAPPTLLTSITQFDHIVIMPNRVLHPSLHSNADLLDRARYAGVVLEKEYDRANDVYTVRGQGMAWHLGDANGMGPTRAANVSYSAASLTTVLSQIAAGGILPPAVQAGTITTTGVGTFTGNFEEADLCIDMLRTVAASLNLTWRVNPNGKIDVCLKTRDDVFRTTAAAIKYAVVRDGWGYDPEIRSLQAEQFLTRVDARNYATRVILVGDNYDGSHQILSFKNRDTLTFDDIHGNRLVRSVKVSSPPTDPTINIDTWFTRQFVDWSVEFDVEVDAFEEELANGQVMVGDHFFLYDAPSVRDETNGRWHRGRFLPFRIEQAVYAEWHPKPWMDVLCRHRNGTWTRLSKYVRWE